MELFKIIKKQSVIFLFRTHPHATMPWQDQDSPSMSTMSSLFESIQSKASSKSPFGEGKNGNMPKKCKDSVVLIYVKRWYFEQIYNDGTGQLKRHVPVRRSLGCRLCRGLGNFKHLDIAHISSIREVYSDQPPLSFMSLQANKDIGEIKGEFLRGGHNWFGTLLDERRNHVRGEILNRKCSQLPK